MMNSCPVMKNLIHQEQIYFFTSWVKLSEHEILAQHMVDIQKATAKLREASERKRATFSHKKSSSKHFATVRLCRGDSASTTGTLDPVGEEDAFEKPIAGR